MATAELISVKLYYQDDVRRTRVAANTSYADVIAAAQQTFGGAGDLAWKDEDGDLVNIRTDADWSEAVTANPKLVKLVFTPAQQSQSHPMPVEIQEEDDTPATPENLKMPEGSEFILAELASETTEQAGYTSTQATISDNHANIRAEADTNSTIEENSKEFVSTKGTENSDVSAREDGERNANGQANGQHQEPQKQDQQQDSALEVEVAPKAGDLSSPEIPDDGRARCFSRRKAAYEHRVVSSPEFAEARKAILNKPAVHYGIECDASGQNPIVGTRYHLIHYNYDVNEDEFNKLSEEQQALFESIARPGAEPVPVSSTTVPIIRKMIKGHKAARAERRRLQREKEAKEIQRPYYAYIPAGDVIPPFRAALGSIGPGVVQLQHALIAVGAMSPDVISYRAGFFGPGTTKAIREYKAEQGIESHPYQYGTYDEAVYDSLIDKIDALVNDSDGSADDVQESKQQKPENKKDKKATDGDDDTDYVVVDATETTAVRVNKDTTSKNTESVSAASTNSDDVENIADRYANAGITEGEQWESELKGLSDMGFVDTDKNRRLLHRHHGALPFVIAGLI